MTQPRTRPHDPPNEAPRTVLIVEDDPSIALGLRINLEAEGYRVLAADDGEKGLAAARALGLMIRLVAGGDRGGVGWRQAHESGQQVTDLGHGQRQQIRGEVGRDHTPR